MFNAILNCGYLIDGLKAKREGEKEIEGNRKRGERGIECNCVTE